VHSAARGAAGLRRRLGAVWVGLGCALACAVLFAAADSAAGASGNLIPNPSFESGGSYSFSGWGLTNASDSAVSAAESGSWAAKIQPSGSTSSYGIFVRPQPVASAIGGSRYQASVWLRTDKPGKTVCLNLRDLTSGGSQAQPLVKTCAAAGSSWAQLTTPTLTVANSGDSIGLTITQAAATSSDSFEVDNASLVQLVSQDATAPSIPTNLHTTQVTATSVTLAWNASTDPDNASSTLTYRVSRGGTVVGTTAAGATSFTNSGLSAGHQYSYTVSAVDPAGNASTASASLSVTTSTATDTTAPSIPTNLHTTQVAATSVTLAWNASTDPDNASSTLTYRVSRGGTVVGTTAAGATSFTNSGLSAGHQYSYTVSAVDPAGNASAPSSALQVTTASASDTTAPTAPTGVTATANGTSSITVTWKASTDSDNASSTLTYDVYRYTTKVGSVAGTAPLSFTDTGLQSGTSVSYDVVARDPAGNQSPASKTAWATTTSSPTTAADWKMDEPAGSTTMIDSSSNGNNGALTNVKTGVPGYTGTGYSFTPKAYASVPSSTSLNPGYRDIRVTLHLKTTSLPSSGDFDLLRKGKSPNDVEYKVELLQSGQILCALHGSVAGTYVGLGVQSSGSSLANGHWHTIVCARTSYRTVSLNVDGTQYTATLSSGSLGTISPSSNLYIGANPVAGNDYYGGSLDDVTVQVG
jgi:chitodextrinase